MCILRGADGGPGGLLVLVMLQRSCGRPGSGVARSRPCCTYRTAEQTQELLSVVFKQDQRARAQGQL